MTTAVVPPLFDFSEVINNKVRAKKKKKKVYHVDEKLD